MKNADPALSRLRVLSKLLDSQFEGPFGVRFGLDALIGLIPVVGDLSTSGVSLYLILEAHRMGVPNFVILRMVLNIAIESLIGMIPFVGDAFDVYWKSNLKNVQLLEAYGQAPENVATRSKVFIYGVVIFLMALIFACMFLGVLLLKFLLSKAM